MKPQTEELLYFLLWTATPLLAPTWRNLNDSFEEWAWRNGLSRRLALLERQKLIERQPAQDLRRIVRLTEAGRVLGLGGRDPAKCWARPWDGRWRMVLFDIPRRRGDLRRQLLRVLRRMHLGCVQKSMWITPDPADEIHLVLDRTKADPKSFMIVDAKPAAGESDAEMVTAGWDFQQINHRHEHYIATVREPIPSGPSLVEWGRRENAAWRAAVDNDPLLPAELLPPDYRGRDTLQARLELFAKLSDVPATG